MFEFFKLLVEEPGKLRKLGVFLSKGIVNLIFTLKLYGWIIGKFYLLDVTDLNALLGFVTSGRILICVFLFVVSDILLFNILPMFLYIPLDWICKLEFKGRLKRKEKNQILKLMSYFELISLDEKNKKIKAAKHTDDFYGFLTAASEKESRSEMDSIKTAFVTEALNTYSAFVLVYFFFLRKDFPSKTLLALISLGCIVLPLVYIAIRLILDFIYNNAQKLAREIQGLRYENLINESFRQLGIFPFESQNPSVSGYHYGIFHNKKTYILRLFHGKFLMPEYFMKHSSEIAIKENAKMLVFSNQDLSRDAKHIAEEHKLSLVVIQFDDESDLISKIEEFAVKP